MNSTETVTAYILHISWQAPIRQQKTRTPQTEKNNTERARDHTNNSPSNSLPSSVRHTQVDGVRTSSTCIYTKTRLILRTLTETEDLQLSLFCECQYFRLKLNTTNVWLSKKWTHVKDKVVSDMLHDDHKAVIGLFQLLRIKSFLYRVWKIKKAIKKGFLVLYFHI